MLQNAKQSNTTVGP